MTWHKFKDGKIAIDLSRVTHIELCDCYHGEQFEADDGDLYEERTPYWTVDICFVSGRLPQRFQTEEAAKKFFNQIFNLLAWESTECELPAP